MFKKIEKWNVIKSLSRHKDIDRDFLEKIKEIPKEIVENLGTDLAKRAVSMSRDVDGDLHEHKAFLRLSISPNGILYAKLDKMKHFNEEPLLKFFKKRFPTFLILFESKRGVFTINEDFSILITKSSLEKVLEEWETKLPENSILRELNEKSYNYQDLWESFAQSQIITGKETSSQVLTLSKRWKRTVPVDKTLSKSLDDFLR